MNLDLKRFFKHSAVYTFGNLIYRGAGFLLVPLYAHYLLPAEYGMLEIFYVTAAIAQTLFASGVAHAALRFYFEYERPEDKNAVVSTAWTASFVFTLAGATVLCFFAPFFSEILFGTTAHALPFRLAFFTLVFEISREISLAFVRAKEKSSFFVVMSVFQLVVQVLANVYTVVILKMGVVGILAGNLAATFVIWMILTGFTLGSCGLRFEWGKLWPAVKYGYPLMWSSLAGSILYSADRYLLNTYANLAAVGVYAIGLRLAKIIPILVVDPFTKSFGPFRFSVMHQDNAGQIYARILTYYVFIASFIVLGLSVFSEEIVKGISTPEYWEAYRITPMLVIPSALGGVTYCFQTGIYIQKRTKSFFYITTASGLLSVGLNLVAIPRWGIYGAAWTGVITTIGTVFLTYAVAQRLYPVPYEFGRMAKIVLSAAVIGVAAFQVHFENWFLAVFTKLMILCGFPFLVGAMQVYRPEEIRKIGEVWGWLRMKRQSKPATL